MAKSNTATATATATAPVVTSAASVPPKAPRYAPVALIANPNAVISVLVPNPKLPGSKAHAKFACYKSGQTITEFTAAIVAAGFKSIKARNSLRWDLSHGFITLTTNA